MWKSFLCEAVDVLTYNKISTRSVMAEMFYSEHANNSEANSPNSLIPLLSRTQRERERESFGRVFEKLQEPQYHRECFTKLELNSAGNISEKKKKKESIFLTFNNTDPTRQVDQQESLVNWREVMNTKKKNGTKISSDETKCDILHQLVFAVRL